MLLFLEDLKGPLLHFENIENVVSVFFPPFHEDVWAAKRLSEEFSLSPALPHMIDTDQQGKDMYSCCIVGLADSGGGGVQFTVRSGL